jgi:hypothetical protein
MILRGCCSSASIFGFFIRGSCIMIRLNRITVSSVYLSMIFRKTSSHPSGRSPRACASGYAAVAPPFALNAQKRQERLSTAANMSLEGGEIEISACGSNVRPNVDPSA